MDFSLSDEQRAVQDLAEQIFQGSSSVERVKAVERGQLQPDAIDEHVLQSFLFTGGMPDPDLVIRTSGEYRISNFWLWELAYSELVFTDTLWPDFRRGHLFDAVREFQGRDRRFGTVKQG